MRSDSSENPQAKEIVAALMALLDEAGEPDDPAALEHLAATLLVALDEPGMPAEVSCALLAALEARCDASAAGLLAALGQIASPPLAGRARAATDRLAGEGIVARGATGVGRLGVEDAVRIEGPGAEILVALLARPGASAAQAALLAIEHEDTGGALVQCALTPPAPRAEAGGLLDGLDGGGDARQPIGREELAARVVAAARRALDAEIALSHEAAAALPIVSRALTGDPAGLPRPPVLAPWEDDDVELVVDPAADEEGFQRVMEMLLSELQEHAEAHHPPGGSVWQHSDFVASTMLQFKGDCDDGRLGRWTEPVLAAYLLDYFPRKVSADDETLVAVPECVRAFLGFLDARDSLSGEPLAVLEQALDGLSDAFVRSAHDSSRWGMAKTMVMQMLAEGVDLGAPGALDAWIEDFNARPSDERAAVMGAAVDGMVGAGRARAGAAARTPAGRRKAQRRARRRSRRG